MQVIAADRATVFGCTALTGSGLWKWIGTNHDEIAALCMIGGFIITAISAAFSIYIKYQEKRHGRSTKHSNSDN